MNIVAYFDSLTIARLLSERFPSLVTAEISLFSYLACLLHVYDGKPSTQWGYRFAVTKTGYPFTTATKPALQALVEGGMLEEDAAGLRVTSAGKKEFDCLSELQKMNSRLRYLRGSCSTSLAMFPGRLRRALAKDPDLSRARTLTQERFLLDQAGLHALHEQFQAVHECLPQRPADLVVPALVWLSYIDQTAEFPKRTRI